MSQDLISKTQTEISARDFAESMREILGRHGVEKPDELQTALNQLWENIANQFPIEHGARITEQDNPNSKWLMELFGERLLALFDPTNERTVAGEMPDQPVMPREPLGRTVVAEREPREFENTRWEKSAEEATQQEPESIEQGMLAGGSMPEQQKKVEISRHAPLEGDRARVTLQTLARVRQLYEAPGELMAFLANAVAPALTRLETNRQATPEELVDVVLGPLAGRRLPGTPLGDWRGVARLVAGLRGFLEKQKPEERGVGYYKTRGALPQWLQKIDDLAGGDPDCRRLIVFYYHELLSLGPVGVKDDDLFGLLANNLGGVLAEIWQDRPGEAQGLLLSRIQALATAARLRGGADEPDRAGMAGQLFEVLGVPFGAGRAHGMVQALMIVANIPPAWRKVDALVLSGSGKNVGTPQQHDEDWMTLMSCAAGIVRMAYNERDDWDEIPSSLFNAGVALARIKRAARGDVQSIVAAQVACNAVGLIWALAHGRDWSQVLDEFHGIDCAVNLFGALTEWQPEHGDAAKAAMGRLAGGLAVAGAVLDEARQIEFVRLRASWEKLDIKVGAARQSPTALLEVLDALLQVLKIGLPGHTGLQGDAAARRVWMTDTANALGKRLQDTFTPATYDALATSLGDLLESLFAWSADLQKAWDTLYADIAEPAINMDDTVEGSRDRSGPLVKLGEMTRAAWIELARRAIDPPLTVVPDSPTADTRLGPWLADFFGKSGGS